MTHQQMALKYGCNPHQTPARVYSRSGPLPVRVLNGNPGYINLLDALNSWQLVSELRGALAAPAAASFKHVNPSGAAIGVPLSESLKKAYFVDDLEVSPLAAAYMRARGADRVASYGDWVGLSDTVDISTALLLRREASDGVIAPGYDPEALTILKKKRGGNYIVLEIEREYEPPQVETRDVFGVVFEERRNDIRLTADVLSHTVTNNLDLPETAKRDLLIALVTLKYTLSNSMCLAVDGQTIGVGAGQQSRIHCTRLAASKAEMWYLRQHPRIQELRFKQGLPRPERDNVIDQYLREDLTPTEYRLCDAAFEQPPGRLTREEKRGWLRGLTSVALGSDGFIPFRDNIDRAVASGTQYVVQPGGSARDQDVIDACNEYGIVMVFSHVRLFYH